MLKDQVLIKNVRKEQYHAFLKHQQKTFYVTLLRITDLNALSQTFELSKTSKLNHTLVRTTHLWTILMTSQLSTRNIFHSYHRRQLNQNLNLAWLLVSSRLHHLVSVEFSLTRSFSDGAKIQKLNKQLGVHMK